MVGRIVIRDTELPPVQPCFPGKAELVEMIRAKIKPHFRPIYQSQDVIVFETQPQLRTISLVRLTCHEVREKHTYQLYFPYMQWYFYDGRLNVSMTNQPLRCHDDPVCIVPLPNIYKHFVCLGGLYFPSRADPGTAISHFWFSEFVSAHLPKLPFWLHSYERWQKLSLKKPHKILKISWRKGGTMLSYIDLMRCRAYAF